jgi:hypothetical protein
MAKKKQSKKVSSASKKFGDITKSKGKQAGSLYPTKKYNPGNYRPRIYTTAVDTKHSVTQRDRLEHVVTGRSLFSTLPDLGNALVSKAGWAVGPSAFTPIFNGKDQVWGDTAEEWLQNIFYPACNTMGAMYDFRTTLSQTSLALDVDGDSLMVLTKSRAGFPQIAIIPSHRVGTRGNAKTVEDGKYFGYEIHDGVITNPDGRPVAYRILGDKPEDDYDVAAQSVQLLYEPEWSDQYRGVSRIARPSNDFTDQQDIDEFLKQGVKLASEQGLIIHNEAGEADLTDEELAAAIPDAGAIVNPTPYETETAPGYRYFKAGLGEKIESVKDERPSQNTAAFIERIQRRALAAVGWPIELLDPSKVGAASVRLIQDLARKTVAARQVTLEKRARLIVNYALALAMQNGYLPRNNGDWYNWTFSKGAAICVDLGNESAADLNGYHMGTITLQEIAAKRGLDWYQLRNQSEKEVDDLLERAARQAAKHNVPMATALTLIQANTPNQAPVSTPQSPVDNKGRQPQE